MAAMKQIVKNLKGSEYFPYQLYMQTLQLQAKAKDR